MKLTCLYDQHLKLGAKTAPFAGFHMPLQYSSVKDEVLAVRRRAGVFDTSHMGEFFVEGRDAIVFVDYLLCNDFAGIGLQKALYSPLCRENGTVIDDLIAYKLSPEKVLICVNAANVIKDWEWINSHTGHFAVKLQNVSEQWSMLALQGSRADAVLQKLNILNGKEILPFGVLEHSSVFGKLILARTGYTGEDGFEIFASHQGIQQLWDKLMDLDVTPCGLAARDVLRLEAGYPLYGHELTDEITPLDAGLKWTVKIKTEKFLGKKALSDYIPKYRSIKLVLSRGIPRESYPILNTQKETIGYVTSGTLSVTLNKGIAMGRVRRDRFPKEPDKESFYITIRNKDYPAQYKAKSFIS